MSGAARREGSGGPVACKGSGRVILREGFAEGHRAAVARLFWEAFGDKLRLPLGDAARATAYVARALDPDHAMTAAGGEEGALLGAAGIKTASGGLLRGRTADLRAVYGPLGALWRGAALALYDRPVEPGVLLMDGLFVAPEARGRGVGTRLLHAVAARARAEGYGEVRLDVVDGNRARDLYERQGFRAVGRIEAGWLGPALGFQSATTMRLALAG